MQRTINEQKHELIRLAAIEEKYMSLLDSDIEHSQTMMRNLLEICVTPGVLQALEKNPNDHFKTVQPDVTTP
jgi:hypothetical protein